MDKFIDFIITQQCTYSCSYCSQSKNETVNKPFASNKTIDNFLKFLDKLDKDFEITITGGEALLHKQFNHIIEEIKNKNFKINLITNFSFSIDKYQEIFEILKNNLNKFDISCHLSEIKSFDEFIKKIDNLSDSNKYNTKIRLLIPIFNLDYAKEDKIGRLITFAKEKNIQYEFQHIRVLNNYQKISKFEEKYLQNNKIKSFARYCYAGCKSCVIYEDGSIYRCYSSRFNKSNYLGNIDDSNFELNKIAKVCTQKFCTCPKPIQYNQLTNNKNIIKTIFYKIYNFSNLPILIIKNHYIIHAKIMQFFNLKKHL